MTAFVAPEFAVVDRVSASDRNDRRKSKGMRKKRFRMRFFIKVLMNEVEIRGKVKRKKERERKI